MEAGKRRPSRAVSSPRILSRRRLTLLETDDYSLNQTDGSRALARLLLFLSTLTPPLNSTN